MKRFNLYPGFSIFVGMFLKLSPILLGFVVFLQIILLSWYPLHLLFFVILIIIATSFTKFYSNLPLEVGVNPDDCFEVRIWRKFRQYSFDEINRVVSFSRILPHLNRNTLIIDLKDRNLLERFIVVSLKDKSESKKLELLLQKNIDINYPTLGFLGEPIKF